MEKINKYQNGKIYKIVDNGYNMVYYGSTTQPLCNRMAKHRDKYRKNKLDCTVKKIFNEYGLENCKIELVENFSCNNRNELEAREGYYIKNNDCINKYIAGRKKKEYYEDTKDIRLQQMKEYYEVNKDTIKEYKRQYNKQYQEANKDKIKEYKRQYYLKRKTQNQI